jgi:hypothetical protein
MLKGWLEKRRQKKEDEDKKALVVDRLETLEAHQINEAISDPGLREDAEWLCRAFPWDYCSVWLNTLQSFEIGPDRFDPTFEDDIFTLSVFLAGVIAGREDAEVLKREVEAYRKSSSSGKLTANKEEERMLFEQENMFDYYELEMMQIDNWLREKELSYTSLRDLLIHARLGCLNIDEINVARIMDMIDAWPDRPHETDMRYKLTDSGVAVAVAEPIDSETWQRDRDRAIETWQNDRAGKPEPSQALRRAVEPAQPAPAVSIAAQAHGGRAAIFVFDYDKMSVAYGIEVFQAIDTAVAGSTGACAFVDGDLEVSAGGPTGVPGLLMEIRDNGWDISSHRTDSPLILLAGLDRLYAYVAVMWTDNHKNIDVVNAHLVEAVPEGYLGYMSHPDSLEITKFHEIFRPLHLPIRETYVDGQKTSN